MARPTKESSLRNAPPAAVALKQVDWYVCAGSLLLFIAWLFQNHYQPKWHDQKLRLDRTQEAIFTNEGLSNQYYLALIQEAAKSGPDKQLMAREALQYVAFTSTILKLAAARLDDAGEEGEQLYNAQRHLADDIVARFNKEDYDGVITTAGEIRKAEELTSRKLNDQFTTKYLDIENAETTANWLFEGFYISGAVILAMGYLRQRRLRH